MSDNKTNDNNNDTTNMVLTGESSTQILDSKHSDYIFKVQMDNYGRRMATCSADRCVRLWDLQDTGEWRLVGQWTAHRGVVTDLAFAHPEFGRLLATCGGSDHEAIVWEETTQQSMTTTTSTGNNSNHNNTNNLSSRWIQRASLTDARRSVTCVEFAPRHWGLKLAVGSADGCVRIYEAVDISNLAQWPLHATLKSTATASSGQAQSSSHDVVNSLSWCTGRFEPLTLVVGGSQLKVYRYVESARAWHAILQLPCQQQVLNVAWAPNVGRRVHVIAATLDTGGLVVYELLRELQQDNNNNKDQALTLQSEQSLPTTAAWSCQWNVTGTVLASSGDGGVVQLWKKFGSDESAEYVCVSQVVQGGGEAVADDGDTAMADV